MVKIEKLKDATGTIVRNNKPLALYTGMVLTDEEFSTLQVTSGTVVYSVNEERVLETSAIASVPQDSKSSAVSAPAPEQSAVEPAASPKIVYPNKKRK